MDEQPTYTFKQPSKPVFALMNEMPSHNITFHNGRKQVGVLDFNGPEMTFSGDMDESAKIFFEWIATSFKGRLEQERKAEREEIAQMCDEVDKESQSQWPKRLATMIRARGNT